MGTLRLGGNSITQILSAFKAKPQTLLWLVHDIGRPARVLPVLVRHLQAPLPSRNSPGHTCRRRPSKAGSPMLKVLHNVKSIECYRLPCIICCTGTDLLLLCMPQNHVDGNSIAICMATCRTVVGCRYDECLNADLHCVFHSLPQLAATIWQPVTRDGRQQLHERSPGRHALSHGRPRCCSPNSAAEL